SDLFFHSFFNQRRHEAFDCATQLKHFFDQSRADVRVTLGGHHKHGLDVWLEPPIHERHLKLILVIRDGADTPQDHVGLLGHGVFHEQSTERINAQFTASVVDELQHFGEHPAAFFDAEERLLLRVNENGDNNFIEEFAAALDDIQVAVSYGVE